MLGIVSKEKYEAMIAERDQALTEKNGLQAILDSTATKLNCEVKDLVVKLDEMIEAKNALEGTNVNELVQANETLTKERDQAKTDLATANHSIGTLKTSISEKEQKISDLQATIDRLNNKPGEEPAKVVTPNDGGNIDTHANLRNFCETNEDDINAVLAKIQQSGLYD